MATKFSFTISVNKKGLGKLRAAIRSNISNFSEAMAEGVYRESQTEVPVDTGRLKRSGKVIRNNDKTASITYGGRDAIYAPIIHEDRSLNLRNGKAGYLRDPLLRAKNSMEPLLKEIKRRLRL